MQSEESKDPNPKSDFEEFWNLYPRKICKKYARECWFRRTPLERAEAIRTIPDHVRMWKAESRSIEFIPHASSWINGERWTDEIALPKEKIPPIAVAWWACDDGILGKGRELKLHPKGGESMLQFKARVVEAARRAA